MVWAKVWEFEDHTKVQYCIGNARVCALYQSVRSAFIDAGDSEGPPPIAQGRVVRQRDMYFASRFLHFGFRVRVLKPCQDHGPPTVNLNYCGWSEIALPRRLRVGYSADYSAAHPGNSIRNDFGPGGQVEAFGGVFERKNENTILSPTHHSQ
jgi:hypothetical protein